MTHSDIELRVDQERRSHVRTRRRQDVSTLHVSHGEIRMQRFFHHHRHFALVHDTESQAERSPKNQLIRQPEVVIAQGTALCTGTERKSEVKVFAKTCGERRAHASG